MNYLYPRRQAAQLPCHGIATASEDYTPHTRGQEPEVRLNIVSMIPVMALQTLQLRLSVLGYLIFKQKAT